MTAVVNFIENEDGATAIEYGLITALIAVGLIAAFVIFGESLLGLFGYVRDKSTAAMSG